MEEALRALFRSQFNEEAASFEPIPAHASNRSLFRIQGRSRSVIGAYGPDAKENAAFLGFSKHFRAAGLPVPEIYAEDREHRVYIEEDLGDTTLFELLSATRTEAGLSAEVERVYERVVAELPRFQVQAATGLDYGLCYPRASFDRQSMMWDLSYFKYYFLRLAKVPFNEQALEDDFERFAGFLLEAERDHFLYRDFQSRNVMVREIGRAHV